MTSQELFIWPAPSTSYRSSLMPQEGLVGSCNFSGRRWWLLVAPGIIIWTLYYYLSKPILFISQGYSERPPRGIFWIIQNAWRRLFSRPLDPRPENQIKLHCLCPVRACLPPHQPTEHFVIQCYISKPWRKRNRLKNSHLAASRFKNNAVFKKCKF